MAAQWASGITTGQRKCTGIGAMRTVSGTVVSMAVRHENQTTDDGRQTADDENQRRIAGIARRKRAARPVLPSSVVCGPWSIKAEIT